MGISAPAEFGGQGLPETMTTVVNEFMASANMAFAMYPGLTQGAIAAILTHGSPEQKAAYLPKMIEGRWTGTMNLTEPHCGTDLGLLRTKAVKQGDGSYKITGTKIFISARRARPRREHRASRAGAHRRRARRHPRHHAVHRAEIPAQRRRLARRAQRRHLRLDRGEDGHPRQRHLRDELRRRDRLPDRRGEPRHQRHVHDDERGAAGVGVQGLAHVGGRLPERRRLCAGPPAGPRARRARSFPTSRPIRSSCIPTCAAC